MIGLIMCGGRGTRMGLGAGEEKLMLKLNDVPLIQRIVDSFRESEYIDKTVAAVNSYNAPGTSQFLSKLNIEKIETPGHGFGNDMNFSLRRLSGLVLVVPADLALLDAKAVDGIICKAMNLSDGMTQQQKQKKADTHDRFCISVMLSEEFLRKENLLGQREFWIVSTEDEKLYYSGISLVDASALDEYDDDGVFSEEFLIVDDGKLAVNINTKKDYDACLGL